MTVNRIQGSILQKIQKTINKFRMLGKGDKVLVAFSGGPDSSLLLLLLNELKRKYGISIYAGHVNHMLRGKESLEDERIAKKRCEELKIPCRIAKKNVKKLKRKGESVEEAARRIRYDALEEIAKGFSANKIALGHNRDDQVETILLRIIRGTGEDGLSGIPEIRVLNSGIKLIRPLIEIERKEIEEYLKSKGLKPRFDSSNLDVKFSRNRIRHELIPYLEKYNPQIKDGLLKLAQLSKENSEYIREQTRSILKQISKRLPYAMRIDLTKLLIYPKVLHNHVLREAIRQVAVAPPNLNYSNMEEICKIISSRRANLFLYLPSGLKIVKEYKSLFIGKGDSSKISIPKNSYHYLFEKQGEFHIPEIEKTIYIDYIKKNDNSLLKFDDSSRIYLDGDKIKFPMILRTRKKGDRFFPFGMKKEKKLKDFFIDEKIPLGERDRIPILVTQTGKILWIVGYRRSNLGIITKDTPRIMRITL